jgi:hypothetical protein
MSDNLKLVLSNDDADEDSIVGRVKRVDELVDELIAANAALKEEMEQIRLALGMDRYDFDKFKQDGFRFNQSTAVVKAIDDVVEKLEKVLGYE